MSDLNIQPCKQSGISNESMVQRFRCLKKGHEFDCVKSNLPDVCPVCRKQNLGDCGGIWLSRFDEVSCL